ncbi:hypothetical protein, partial [Pseudomonas amygdali]|uniref:hypothetical protein n=1 Tax=Pseudomonas amygdali TaxID=47877 RepID=UPI001C81C56E
LQTFPKNPLDLMVPDAAYGSAVLTTAYAVLICMRVSTRRQLLLVFQIAERRNLLPKPVT